MRNIIKFGIMLLMVSCSKLDKKQEELRSIFSSLNENNAFYSKAQENNIVSGDTIFFLKTKKLAINNIKGNVRTSVFLDANFFEEKLRRGFFSLNDYIICENLAKIELVYSTNKWMTLYFIKTNDNWQLTDFVSKVGRFKESVDVKLYEKIANLLLEANDKNIEEIELGMKKNKVLEILGNNFLTETKDTLGFIHFYYSSAKSDLHVHKIKFDSLTNNVIEVKRFVDIRNFNSVPN